MNDKPPVVRTLANNRRALHEYHVLERIEAGDADLTPDTAFLGVSAVSVDSLDDATRDRLGITAESGAFVQDVTPDSAAERGGLQRGDVITELAGEQVTSSEDVARIVRSRRPGDRVDVVVERDGDPLTLQVTLDTRGG